MTRSAYPRNLEKSEEGREINASNPNLKCHRCNGRYKANDLFKSKECYVCRKKGHIANVCRSKSFRNNWETNLVKEKEKEDLHEDSIDKIFNVYKLLSGGKQEPYRINVVINSKEIIMEIDTGSSITIINYGTYLKLCTRTKEKVIIQQLSNNSRLNPTSTAEHFCIMLFSLLSHCATIK